MLARHTIGAERHSLLAAVFKERLTTVTVHSSDMLQVRVKEPWISNLLKIPFESLYFWRIAMLLLLFCLWGISKGYNCAAKLWVNRALIAVPSFGSEQRRGTNGHHRIVSLGSHKKETPLWHTQSTRKGSAFSPALTHHSAQNSTNHQGEIREERAIMSLQSCLGQCTYR